jgi:hypothetical protein
MHTYAYPGSREFISETELAVLEDCGLPLSGGASDPCALDGDADGVNDCEDGCPQNPAKSEPGDCGCGVADTDTDGDGSPDCVDECPFNPARTALGECGCEECPPPPEDDPGQPDDTPTPDDGANDPTGDSDQGDDEQVLGDTPVVPPAPVPACGATAQTPLMAGLLLAAWCCTCRQRRS